MDIEQIITEEIASLQEQGAGSDRYFLHSSAHATAGQKYKVAVQRAKASGNAELAKKLNKIGREHLRAAEVLRNLGTHHVDAAYSRQMDQKDAKKQMKLEETELDESFHPMHKKLIKAGWKHTYHPEQWDGHDGDAENGPSSSGFSPAYHHYTKKGETHDHYISQGKHEKVRKPKHHDNPPFQPGENSKAYKEYARSVKEDTDMEDDIIPENDALTAALDRHPVAFQDAFEEMIRAAAAIRLGQIQNALANESVEIDEGHQETDIK